LKTILIAEIGHCWVPFGWKSIPTFIDMIKDTGWDVAKFQSYDTDKIKQPGDTNYDELKEAELSYEQLQEARDICASAFDVERVRWLEKLGVKRHKLASRSINDLGLIVAMRETNKQIIASLGNYDGPFFPDFKADFLFCVTRRQILRDGFPADKFRWALQNGHSGFSDHCVGNQYAIEALDSKVKILEKHITIDKNSAGWDTPAAADFNDMFEIGERNGKR
jgi:sialic acid synthase SpsE